MEAWSKTIGQLSHNSITRKSALQEGKHLSFVKIAGCPPQREGLQGSARLARCSAYMLSLSLVVGIIVSRYSSAYYALPAKPAGITLSP